ncbi:DUF4160 domain-containing protein [Paraburkholderia atlantica]|uniref:DUF4160 domain-containing protein n=1 Tax=Paraburkholderia atlantica TaxID=2654982 RepID=UPI002AAFAA6D|nr:DUF4160 domain-containing protein [Paraburkholderia atlantica]
MEAAKAFRYNGIRFFFYSNEGDPREPVHIHAQRGSSVAKIWLYPDVRVASSSGFSKEQVLLMDAVEQNRELIERRWNEHFS